MMPRSLPFLVRVAVCVVVVLAATELLRRRQGGVGAGAGGDSAVDSPDGRPAEPAGPLMGPRGPGPAAAAAAAAAASDSSLWPLPPAPWEWCWPRGDACVNVGLCEEKDPFQPLLKAEQLARCGQLATDDSTGKVLQMYHVSKCGGTTINTLFKSKSKGGAGGLTPAGEALLRHERENFWDPEYKSPVRPNSSFIIGTIRNPFEYYVSFWSMFTLKKMKGTFDCLRGSAINYGRHELFDNRGRRNVKQFRAWLHFLFVESCDPCKLTMWRIFQSLYVGAPGACPSYDRMVRLERFYPTLTQALRDYEKHSPRTINWEVVEDWHKKRHNTIRDGPECPHHCFYDDHTRRLVEIHDAPLLEHFGYSFQETADRHGGAEACKRSACEGQ